VCFSRVFGNEKKKKNSKETKDLQSEKNKKKKQIQVIALEKSGMKVRGSSSYCG